MKADRIIITQEELDLDIKELTLLSDEEYHNYKHIIPEKNYGWWLRSAFYGIKCFAGFVNEDGDLDYVTVKHKFYVVPLLRIDPDNSSEIEEGDKLSIKGLQWTALSDSLILCDENIGLSCFREDWKAEDANDFKASDVSEVLIDWWKS